MITKWNTISTSNYNGISIILVIQIGISRNYEITEIFSTTELYQSSNSERWFSIH